ncbi:MAG TPA: sodium:solute symporter family protein [Candidatus Acidoferrales bacterium]|jgi:SSS family solute:Na+ symporter|nr:sodium:solute symporter family protein [Candidatus Acidoferrales bacterium]
MQPIQLQWIDYTILLAYVAFILGIGWALARYMKSSTDFLTSGRSIPTWVTGLAFISANLGALELVGMAASGAKYGIATAHFYWVGAIPAMIFLAVFMMPFYYGSKARSAPEYLKMRFDERVRILNGAAWAVMTIFMSGISMNALAKLLNLLLHWDYNVSLWICSVVVVLYVFKGGLTSAIYTEVLQFFMIVLGFTPVVYLGLKDVGGWGALKTHLSDVAQNPAALGLNSQSFQPNAWSHAWQPLLAGPANNPMGVDLFAMIFGLGFVLSFGYWCTNFLVVQRAMAAKNMTAARNTPLVAAIPKMLFPAIVILPGMIAAALMTMPDKDYRIPPPIISDQNYTKAVVAVKNARPSMENPGVQAVQKALGIAVFDDKVSALISTNILTPLSDEQIKGGLYNCIAENDYDSVIPSLVRKYCPPGLLALALTALLASFMSGMAGNISAFNTVYTYDLYQSYRRLVLDRPRAATIVRSDGKREDVTVVLKDLSDDHYLWMGKAVTVVGTLLSIGAAYFANRYSNAMDVVQLCFGFVNAPVFATFLLGMFWKRTTGTGAFYGLIGGIVTSAIFHSLTLAQGNLPGIKGGYAHVAHTFPSEMAQNFWLASFAFSSCLILTGLISLATARTKSDEELKGLVYSLTPKITDDEKHFLQRPAVLGVILLICCVILNIIFW